MKCIPALLFAVLLLLCSTAKAQLKKVFVETYYVSDTKDASDTVYTYDNSGNVLDTLSLPAGSTTYRIYVDLKPGTLLTKLYGDPNHILKIASDSVFFNNADRGKSYGYQIKKTDLKKGTVALDTWLTLGQTTAVITPAAPQKPYTYFGVPKTSDTDTSFIGGINNNGGSSSIAGGLLVNNDPAAGIPIHHVDGYMPVDSIPGNWGDGGIVINGNDSTIFGSLVPGKQFISNNAFLENSGVMGVIPDSNQVLVAQLTTRGKISFELNIEVILPDGSLYKYVAKNGADSLAAGVYQNSTLSYPPQCGCNDPNYLEFNSQVACIDPAACKTLVVLGCMDTMACNYDPLANKQSIPSMCCYPGNCQDRDLSLVCADLSVQELQNTFRFDLYPNPVQEQLTIQITSSCSSETTYEIYDSFGRIVSKRKTASLASSQLDVSGWANGFYLVRIVQEGRSATKIFIKN
ncbi:MAG TPA: T9SS type A sorting domain-containing protein, partial [Bacteroidia bacterium]|jgi:hypothetical protein|nr:T9SS type A sorting domain-containing protein [Bacteroidia bacterium]